MIRINKDRPRPVWPEKYNRVLERIGGNTEVAAMMRGIPFIMVSECWLLLKAYYGGFWRTLWAISLYSFWFWRMSFRNGVCVWISDRMGWTKIHLIPQTQDFIAHLQRHGRKCSGSPNCNNEHCIRDSLPRWFKWLTQWPTK